MSSFWSWYIILLVVVNIVGFAIILFVLRKMPKNDNVKQGDVLNHDFDGIQEFNNPLPRWWLWLSWITIIFSIIYLFLYPGLGKYKGYFNWTSKKQWQQSVDAANKKYSAIFDEYTKLSVEDLVNHPKAQLIGKRLFENNCAVCHGADAKGAVGFPSLTDNDWLYGGSADAIVTSISKGRRGMMPPMIAAIGGQQAVKQVANYVLTLSGQPADTALAKKGEPKFKQFCAACHGVNGKGNQLLGAPNLTDNIWLYGGTLKAIEQTITKGRAGVMPAQADKLSPAKIHLLAGYIYHFSIQAKAAASKKNE